MDNITTKETENMTIKDRILSRPVRFQQLMREHLGAFPYPEQGFILTYLKQYQPAEAREIGHRIELVREFYPEIFEKLLRAWQYHCPTYNSLTNANQLFSIVVDAIKANPRPLTLQQQLHLISIISFSIPVFNYEEVITVAMYNDDQDQFVSLDGTSSLKQTQYLRFMASVESILKKEFDMKDIQVVNQTLKLVYAPYQTEIPAGIALLQHFIPNVIMYHKEKRMFVDPAEEYADSPADTWEIGESVTSRIQMFGSSNFFEKGFTEDSLKQSLRVAMHRVSSICEHGNFELPFNKLVALQEELRTPLTHVAFVEGGNANMFTVMEFDNRAFVLYQRDTSDPTIYGYSLTDHISQESYCFEYVIDPEESYRIKPFQW